MSSSEDQHTPLAEEPKNERYEIQWRYSPSDFFPAPRNEQALDCTLKIEQGTAIASINPAVYETNPSLHKQLHQFLDARFKVQEFRTGKAYELDDGALTEYRRNGQRIRHLTSVVSCKFSMTADIAIVRNGKIVFDSAAEREKERLKFKQKKIHLRQLDEQVAATLEQHYLRGLHPEDSLLDSLRASHVAALNDPDNELVYLYELRDALSKKFGDDPKARKALSISAREWSSFGQLANNEPVSQGRHRGKFTGQLRSATEEELVEARRFARKLLLAFLQYLMRSGHP